MYPNGIYIGAKVPIYRDYIRAKISSTQRVQVSLWYILRPPKYPISIYHNDTWTLWGIRVHGPLGILLRDLSKAGRSRPRNCRAWARKARHPDPKLETRSPKVEGFGMKRRMIRLLTLNLWPMSPQRPWYSQMPQL